MSMYDFTRRGLLQTGAAAGLIAGLPFTAARAAAPKKGGTLRMGNSTGSTSDVLDPSLAGDPFTIPMVYGYANNLTEIGADGSLKPELAESWEATNKASVWTFQLRKGVEFHNGKTLDADDVVATFNYHRGEDSKSKVKSIANSIKSVKADGKHTVVFELESGNADFAYIVSDYHFAILPSRDGVVDALGGVGTGPYTVDLFDPGVRIEMTRYPNYWKSDAAYFDAIKMLVITDATARTNALTTGEVDMMDRVELKTASLLAKNPNLVVEEKTGTQHYTLPMRCDTAPFDDVNVRMALKLLVDREAMLKTVLRGHGAVGNDHPISPANQYFDASIPQRAYDPEKAKFHLKQAGLDSLSVKLNVSDAGFGGAVDAAVLLAESARKANVSIEIVREPADGYWDQVWMQKPWTASYWGGRPTEDWMFSTAYDSNAAWNESFWKNERFDTLLLEARVELDRAKRADMYGEMQRLVRDDGGAIVPLFANYIWATSTKIAHDSQVASNWDMDGSKFMERWWFA